MPSVRQQVLKERLSDLYQQPSGPLRVNAFRGNRVKHTVQLQQHDSATAGNRVKHAVMQLEQHGSATAASQPGVRPPSAAQSAGRT